MKAGIAPRVDGTRIAAGRPVPRGAQLVPAD
jgi:hypothetical protein